MLQEKCRSGPLPEINDDKLQILDIDIFFHKRGAAICSHMGMRDKVDAAIPIPLSYLA